MLAREREFMQLAIKQQETMFGQLERMRTAPSSQDSGSAAIVAALERLEERLDAAEGSDDAEASEAPWWITFARDAFPHIAPLMAPGLNAVLEAVAPGLGGLASAAAARGGSDVAPTAGPLLPRSPAPPLRRP
jgi:hypothetical protein